jgi:hypothetical protein
LPILATLIVLVFVVALSAVAIEVGQSRTTAASVGLASSAPLSSDHPRATASPTPSVTYSGPLIAMEGARSLTRAQLHDWTVENTDGSANAAIGEQQDWLTIQCMAARGFLYDPTLDGSQGLERGKTWGLTQHQLQGYRLALWGQNVSSSKPYNWRTAGCHGQSVHLTGQDDNH